MTASESLEATLREQSGTGAARAVRREGRVPAIVYGGGGETVPVSVELRALNRCLATRGLMAMTMELSVNGKSETVRLQDVQRHPVSGEPLHLDFVRVA
jgi:large subunit ribosomal protein L25